MPMNIVILDDYQDVVRKLACAEKLEPYPAKVFTNTVKGVGPVVGAVERRRCPGARFGSEHKSPVNWSRSCRASS